MNYAEKTLDELLALEYDQQLVVQRLEQRPFVEVADELLQAQDTLYAIEQARMAAEIRARAEAEAAAAEAEQEAADQGAAPAAAAPPKKVFRGGTARQSLTGETIRGTVQTSSTQEEMSYVINLPRVPTSIYGMLDNQVDPLVTFTLRRSETAGFPRPSSTRRTSSGGTTFLGAEIKRYRVTSHIQHFSTKSTTLITLRAGEEKSVNQLPTLIPERIANLHEVTRATIDLTIERQKDPDSPDWIMEAQVTEPIWLLAKSSAPQAVRDPATGGWNDLTRFLGAFVTPNSPQVIGFLRTALEKHPNKRFDGYQSNVRSQVAAIYGALQEEKIAYVDSVIDFNPSENAQSQRVRSPSESLTDRMANCIDGVLLFASLLQGISVNPAIVVLPRHAIVGWETGPGSDTWEYLETTMLATHDFDTALKVGNQRVQAYQARFEETQDPAWYRRWSLRDLRVNYGIMPMG